MTFPGHEQDSPQRVSAAVNTAGFAQDVVMATSRLIHAQTLTDRDRQALEACRALLNRMLSTDVAVERSGERQLDGSNTVALLRKARSAQAQDAGDLAHTVTALDQLLKGQRSAEDVEEIGRLRDIFLTVGQANLAAMTELTANREAPDSWTGLIANSIS
jgi:hypothetical protein